MIWNHGASVTDRWNRDSVFPLTVSMKWAPEGVAYEDDVNFAWCLRDLCRNGNADGLQYLFLGRDNDLSPNFAPMVGLRFLQVRVLVRR